MSSDSLGHASESTPHERLQVQKQPLAEDDTEEHRAFAEAALAMILADADQAIALLSKDLNVIRYSQSLLRLWSLSPRWLDQQPCLNSLLNELVALNYWSENAKSELLKQLHAPLPTTRHVTLTITQQDGTVLDLRMRQMQAGQWVLIINRAASPPLGNPNLDLHSLEPNLGIHHTVRHSVEWPQTIIATEGSDRPTATSATDASDARYPSHASEASYRDIVEEQTELIARFLPDNTVTFANEAFCRYFGVSREEVIGKSFDPIIHEDDRERVHQLVQSLSPENPILLIENRVLVNGQVRWTQWIDRMLYDDQGNAVECQAVGRDITKLKTLEDMLRLTNQELALMIETQSAKLKDAIARLKAETIQREQTNAALMESEVRYRSVVAALQEGVILQDAEHRILTCNASAERILGMTLEQCQGRSFSELALFVIQKDGSPFPKDQHPTRVTLNTGEPCSEVIMGFVRNPSEVCWLRVNTQPLIHEGETQPYAVVISFINITKRLQVEERLRLLESVVVNAKDSIVITDASPLETDGPHILYVNDSFSRLTGYSAEEVIGKNPRLLQGDRTNKATLQTIHTALEAREPVMVEIINYTKDQREFWTELSIAPIMDERGTHTHWIAIQRDITQRKQFEEELLKTVQKERELSELKTRFVSATSHEFRTPLSIILSSSELLEHYSKNWTESERVEQLHLIQSTVKHMTKLLEDILLLGQSEAGKLELSLQTLPIGTFCQQMVTELQQGVGKTHQIAFRSFCGDPRLWFDEKLLRQILGNLLSNAVKYSPPQSRIEFYLDYNLERGALFQIQDQGVGIPDEDQSKLFEFFQRASNVGTTTGTGLGLAIAKHCTELHGGTITFSSHVNVGTTFVVQLPLRLTASPLEQL